MRVRAIIKTSSKTVEFCAPASAWAEAENHLVDLAKKRRSSAEALRRLLQRLTRCIHIVNDEAYRAYESEARSRLARHDPDDWPILACALALDCPIWTEDRDFFGCGVATWTSDRVERYFRAN